jgi:hypothetical protein
MPERVVIQMRVRPETKAKLNRLKECNPDVHWDLLLQPIIKDVLLPKAQCASVKEPPKITAIINVPDRDMKAPDELPDLKEL